VPELPLSDVKVLDLTVARAGPTCVRQLADWGAQVVRVEAPEDVLGGGERRHSSDYQNLHRNKRSISLNLKTPEGLGVLYRLVDWADVLVENMRPQVKHRLGFDYERLHRRNPRLVFGSISGFGQDGPYAHRGGVDQIAQGLGGLMSVTGLPGTDPTRVGIPVADLSAGLYLAVGILVALHDRERIGEGRWVRTSLLEAMVVMMDLQAVRYTVDGTVPVQEGNHHPTQIPMGCFRSADGFINVAGPSGRLLRRFCEVIGLPDLPWDPRFDSAAKRSANREELNRMIAERLRTQTTAEWIEVLDQAGVPCGPVLQMDQVFADPQVGHLQLTAQVESPDFGTISILRNPVTMSVDDRTVRSASPRAGEHTESILAELGLTPEEIEALHGKEVI
jgi:crotonobetainyl-CoA:carnitine CoA-transferase CaiB-like acyl-CoA transferase